LRTSLPPAGNAGPQLMDPRSLRDLNPRKTAKRRPARRANSFQPTSRRRSWSLYFAVYLLALLPSFMQRWQRANWKPVTMQVPENARGRLSTGAKFLSFWVCWESHYISLPIWQDRDMMENSFDRRVDFEWSVSRLWRTAGVVLILLACLSVLHTYNPANSNFYPPCLFHALTGLYCPGCGTLRALHQLVHGHLLTAFWLNPLMVLSVPFLGYVFVSRVVLMQSDRSMWGLFIPAAWIWILLGVIILFWILRNIPLYPFSLLSP